MLINVCICNLIRNYTDFSNFSGDGDKDVSAVHLGTRKGLVGIFGYMRVFPISKSIISNCIVSKERNA